MCTDILVWLRLLPARYPGVGGGGGRVGDPAVAAALLAWQVEHHHYHDRMSSIFATPVRDGALEADICPPPVGGEVYLEGVGVSVGQGRELNRTLANNLT